MFTGIIKEAGKIIKIRNGVSSKEIEVQSKSLIKTLEIGDSIAVNGCCLTVIKITKNSFLCDISFNTINLTTFGFMKIGEIVNLEDSLSPGGKLGGHFVSGHIDGVSRILKIGRIGNSYEVVIETPEDLVKFIAPKGSISIDGISLTIADASNLSFSTAIIPFTFDNTNLKIRKPGDRVNLEVDLISRYLAQNLKSTEKTKDQNLKEKLIKHGFIK